MRKLIARYPHLNSASRRHNGLKLPHELDLMPGDQPIVPRPVMRQAYDDLQHGLVDTDMHGERGVEELLKGSVKITFKKVRHIKKD